MVEWADPIARIAVSCAWKIVSKLNDGPFHNVSSSLVDPVKTRRRSGVHYNSHSVSEYFRGGIGSGVLTTTQSTGHRILFVDVRTNLVHSDVEEFSGQVLGERRWKCGGRKRRYIQ